MWHSNILVYSKSVFTQKKWVSEMHVYFFPTRLPCHPVMCMSKFRYTPKYKSQCLSQLDSWHLGWVMTLKLLTDGPSSLISWTRQDIISKTSIQKKLLKLIVFSVVTLSFIRLCLSVTWFNSLHLCLYHKNWYLLSAAF